MKWIFGSFLVTLCALASCHILICKQENDSTIRAVGYNRCVTGRRPREENHAVRFGQGAENRSRAWDMQSISSSLKRLQGGASVGTPWLPEEVLFLSIWLSTHLSHTTETSTLWRIKCERYICIKKCVHSFIEVHKLCLIMFPLVYVLPLYNSTLPKYCKTFDSPKYLTHSCEEGRMKS